MRPAPGVRQPVRRRPDQCPALRELGPPESRADRGQPAQVGVPGEHVARAAHPAQRRHRVLGGAAGADVRRPQRTAGGLPPRHPRRSAGTSSPCSTTSSTCPRSRPARWSSSDDVRRRRGLPVRAVAGARARGAARIDLGPTCRRDLEVVRADELRFRQALLNRLSNVVKFAANGGRRPSRPRLTTATLCHRHRHGMASPTPTSSGSRLLPAGWPRRPPGQGTGLGLTRPSASSAPRRRLCLASAPGHGARRVQHPGQAAGVDPRGGRPCSTLPGVILCPYACVVEDERAVRRAVASSPDGGLAPAGRDPGTAARALPLCAPWTVAVILDIKLPGTAAAGRSSTRRPSTMDIAGTPVVVVSVPPERGSGFALGAADYPVKPVGQGQAMSVCRAVAAATSGPRAGRWRSSTTTPGAGARPGHAEAAGVGRVVFARGADAIESSVLP